MMAQMMNPEKMGSIFQNINKVMEQKMETGELDQESLKKEAQDMYGNMSENPLFSNLMGKMNPGQMNPGQMKQEEPSKKEPSKKEPSKKEKKEKLKKKIEEKKQQRTNK